MEERRLLTRRTAITALGGAAAGLLVPRPGPTPSSSMLTRAIPATGESLPAVGVGTWQTFDVGPSRGERRPLEETLAGLVRGGGSVVDTSPMYRRSEAVVGEISRGLDLSDSLFLATKVWTSGREAGVEQMERSSRLLGRAVIDLIQVHNLVDVRTHLSTLREWKARGRVRYIGVTHYSSSSYPELAEIVRNEPLDFVQVNYSLIEREADRTILPLAADRGVAVIANRPFGGGGAISRFGARPLPAWSAELGCTSWPQLMLKWILAHPAVTCAIPGTGNPNHLAENLAAARGPLPDASRRRLLADLAASL